MKILLLIGLIIILLSCTEKQKKQTDQTDSVKTDNSGSIDFKDNSGQQDDCHVWLADSDTTLLTGEFIKYIKDNGRIKIEWGNNNFKRTLSSDYDCDGAPAWVPTINWSTSKYIGLKYGCGSQCWGTIILPKNDNDSIIERMYDLEIDTLNNRMVYLDNESYDKLIVENFETGKRTNINYKFECKASFPVSCIDSLILNKDRLVIKWTNWANDGKKKTIRTEEFKLRF